MDPWTLVGEAAMTRTCPAGHSYEKTSDCPVCPHCEWLGLAESPLPRIGAPATRALAHLGVTRLDELTAWSRARLLAAHGVGPKAVGILEAALAERGLRLADDPAQPPST
jgi:hypothetical protein